MESGLSRAIRKFVEILLRGSVLFFVFLSATNAYCEKPPTRAHLDYVGALICRSLVLYARSLDPLFSRLVWGAFLCGGPLPRSGDC